MKVLIVEKNPGLRKQVATLLRHSNHQVAMADDPQQARLHLVLHRDCLVVAREQGLKELQSPELQPGLSYANRCLLETVGRLQREVSQA